MLVIETSILASIEGDIADHQSRIVEIDDWDSYVEQYVHNKPLNYSGTMNGKSFKESWEMVDLYYDETHLICEFIDDLGFNICKLAYLVQDEFSLNFTTKEVMYLC